MYGDLRPDFESMTPEEKDMQSRASTAIQEYRLVASGMTYADLGYGTPPPMVKLMEWLAVDADLKSALAEKSKHGN